jgi:rhodanese-related sulfurtransferase
MTTEASPAATTDTSGTMDATTLKALLANDDEIAFIDVREHGQYGEGHPLFAVPCPLSRLELLAPDLIPRRETLVVMVDDDDGVARRAGEILAALGYTNVARLDGGCDAWRDAGFKVFKGVNVPSKTFGELVEHAFHTPSISAEDLADRQARGENLIVLDGRTPAEYQRMRIPGGISCPNAELALRAPALVADPDTTIVVNCAGRTRSIVGAQSLIAAGIENPVVALENGTQGWRLAGMELEYDNALPPLPVLDENARRQARDAGREFETEHDVPSVDRPTLLEWLGDAGRTTYLLDVRTHEEHAADDTARAFVSAPGGQLVQGTDQWVAVRGARIALLDDCRLRASMTAWWLRGMGHAAYVVDDWSISDADALAEQQATALRVTYELPSIESITPAQWPALEGQGATLLDASPSTSYRDRHIDGAIWICRARAGRTLVEGGWAKDHHFVVAGSDRDLQMLLVSELKHLGYAQVHALAGDASSWQQAGLILVSTPEQPEDEACIDYLFFVHDRHDGNLDAARAYLDWETGLIANLDEEELSMLSPK